MKLVRPPAQHASRAMAGAAVGLVTNNTDPDNEGKIKVQFPWLHDSEESFWAPVVSFYAGPDRGSFLIPEVGDEVLCMFERGDVNSPFVVGSLWNGEDKVPGPGNPDGENHDKWFQSRSGHKFIFRDEPGAESITLVDKSGKLKFEIDVPKNLITIEATTGDIFFEAPAGPIDIECKTMEITASNSTKTQVGNQLTETSKDRNETVGANCSATASAALSISTKNMSVSFGTASLSADGSQMKVTGATTQTVGQSKQTGNAIVQSTSGPETMVAGMAKFDVTQFDLAIGAAATVITGMTTITSKADGVMGSGGGLLTVMGGLINYSGGQAINNDASLVTLC